MALRALRRPLGGVLAAVSRKVAHQRPWAGLAAGEHASSLVGLAGTDASDWRLAARQHVRGYSAIYGAPWEHEVEMEAESPEVLVQRIGEAKLRAAGPDWLPLVPGGSYWVLPESISELQERPGDEVPVVQPRVGDGGAAEAPHLSEGEKLALVAPAGWPGPTCLSEVLCPPAVPDAAGVEDGQSQPLQPQPLRAATKRTFQPHVIRRKRKHGFFARKESVGGRKVLRRRMAKGRSKLSA